MVGWLCMLLLSSTATEGAFAIHGALNFASVSLTSQFASLSCKQRPRPFYIRLFPCFLLLFSFSHLYSFLNSRFFGIRHSHSDRRIEQSNKWHFFRRLDQQRPTTVHFDPPPSTA